MKILNMRFSKMASMLDDMEDLDAPSHGYRRPEDDEVYDPIRNDYVKKPVKNPGFLSRIFNPGPTPSSVFIDMYNKDRDRLIEFAARYDAEKRMPEIDFGYDPHYEYLKPVLGAMPR